MFELHYQLRGGRRQTYRCETAVCRVGRGRGNELNPGSRLLARRHACFRQLPQGLFVEASDARHSCWVNGQCVSRFGPLAEYDEVVLGDVRIEIGRLLYPAGDGSAGNGSLTRVPAEVAAVDERPVHRGESADALPAAALHDPLPGSAILPDGASAARDASRPVDEPVLHAWSRIVHEQLISQMDLRRKDVNGMSDSQLREESAVLLGQIIDRLQTTMPSDLNVAALTECVLDEAIGLGPLEQFLNDDTVTEIMVNNHQEIFLERHGRIERSPQQFSSDRTIYAVIERIITPLGRRIDESSPIVDARLKDGSRVNAVIPPLALKGPCLTIRKFPKQHPGFTELVAAGSLSPPIVDFLQVCVQHRKNIVVAGGTGSGKTTLLNVLSNFIPDTERIVTIEDAAELRLVQPNLVALESRPANLEGRGAVPMRDLVRNALRMRPDRIVIGECRGGEAIDMLQAMNTGHDGSLTTVHANTPRDVISRLEVLVLMAGMDLPVNAIREQISSAVDLIIQQTRFPCGARKITRITEVAGMESGTVQLQDIFVFHREGFDSDGRVRGSFRATGCIPGFYESLRGLGHQLRLECFKPHV